MTTFIPYSVNFDHNHEKVKSGSQNEKVSILEDVDFELELIHRDEINVSYIIQLLIKLKSKGPKGDSKIEQQLMNMRRGVSLIIECKMKDMSRGIRVYQSIGELILSANAVSFRSQNG